MASVWRLISWNNSASASLFGRDFTKSTSGFADPTLEFVINLVGPPPIKNIPQAIRYEPEFSLDLLVDLVVPIGEYDDDFVGHKLSTDPKFQFEAHLTRDFHKDLWGSVDLNMVSGGKSSVDGMDGENQDMVGVGFTLGYNVSENIQVTAGYLTSISDSDPTDLQMDVFKMSLVFGWHPLVEGMKRLAGD